MRERMLAGQPYLADDPELARESARAMDLTHRINSTHPADADARRALYDELLGAFGEGSEIRPPFRCDYGYQTTVGARSFANFGLVCLDVARISIGDDVQIGPNVQLLTATHPVEAQARRDKWEGGAADHDRGQRLAGRRRHRLPRREHRGEHRGRGGGARGLGPARERRGRRHPRPGDPEARGLSLPPG